MKVFRQFLRVRDFSRIWSWEGENIPHSALFTGGGTSGGGTFAITTAPGLFDELFPGTLTNNWTGPVLVWSNRTGYYWLAPGTTSPSGDSCDYVQCGGSWYKLPGFAIGEGWVRPDGLPYDAEDPYTIPNPHYNPIGPPPHGEPFLDIVPGLLPIVPSPGGGTWLPTDSHTPPAVIPTWDGTGDPPTPNYG